MSVKDASQRIDAAVSQWSGITSGAHRFGGLEWRLGKTEIGHIHGNTQLDIVFPSKVRDELVTSGRARPHHIYPQIGITFYINTPADIDQAIDLLRLSYEIIQERQHRLAKHIGLK
jgi:hypothetical protein